MFVSCIIDTESVRFAKNFKHFWKIFQDQYKGHQNIVYLDVCKWQSPFQSLIAAKVVAKLCLYPISYDLAILFSTVLVKERFLAK